MVSHPEIRILPEAIGLQLQELQQLRMVHRSHLLSMFCCQGVGCVDVMKPASAAADNAGSGQRHQQQRRTDGLYTRGLERDLLDPPSHPFLLPFSP